MYARARSSWVHRENRCFSCYVYAGYCTCSLPNSMVRPCPVAQAPVLNQATGEPELDEDGLPRKHNVKHITTSLQKQNVTLFQYCQHRMYQERHFGQSGTVYAQFMLDMCAQDQGEKLRFELNRQAKKRLVRRQGESVSRCCDRV